MRCNYDVVLGTMRYYTTLASLSYAVTLILNLGVKIPIASLCAGVWWKFDGRCACSALESTLQWALLTGQAEYVALNMASQENISIGYVLHECGLNVSIAILIYSVNQFKIEWANAQRCAYGRAKHIDIKIHFVRELVN